ncbi:glutamine ABC transporter substrate-binding protein [Streptococcus varani]|uniref:Glutamine ABC transporter substrate-binding protein n=1 Tax=Streptococcus varani TaxID=1608583 RepID=A0A0E4H7X6_9STRE|nr:transporter substrate-binding domain-containing protein [Streptococcus varani]CQR24843.1 glutamine ABC transporter substrate-binding protein [Streptococcus varani]
MFKKKYLALVLLPLLLLLLAISFLGQAGATTSSKSSAPLAAGVQDIVDRGVLRVGVKQDLPNFGYRDPENMQYTGMEIEIAKKVAAELGVKIEFTPVTAQTRGALLDNGQLDMVIATFTITDERKELYNFTTPYYTDAVGFLVRKDSKIASNWEALDGMTIGVTQGSIQWGLLEEIAAEKGIHFNFRELGSNSEVVVALAARRVDAFSIDQSILSAFLGKSNQLLDIQYKPSEYGIVTKKSNTELANYLDQLVQNWNKDGSLQTIYNKFGLTPVTEISD